MKHDFGLVMVLGLLVNDLELTIVENFHQSNQFSLPGKRQIVSDALGLGLGSRSHVLELCMDLIFHMNFLLSCLSDSFFPHFDILFLFLDPFIFMILVPFAAR